MRRSMWSSLGGLAVLSATVAVTSSVGGPSAAATGVFSFTRTDYLLTSNASGLDSVAIGDLDGAHGLDIVATGYTGDTGPGVVNVMLNNGNGTFTTTAYPSCTGAKELVLAQLNPSTDSHLDVGMICDSKYIGRMLGDGSGALAAAESVDVSASGGATGGLGAGIIEFLRFGSLHGPGFVYGGFLGLGGTGALALCVLDVTQFEGDLVGSPTHPSCDGFPGVGFDPFHYEMSLNRDLVVGPFKPGYESAIGIGHKEGNNPLGVASWVYDEDPSSAVGYTSGWRQSGGALKAVALADVDNDTKPDVIMAGGDDTTGVLTDFVPGFPIVPDSAPTNTRSSLPYAFDLATGDFDGDGNVDAAVFGYLASGSSDEATVGIHRGLGNGTFTDYEAFPAQGDAGVGTNYSQTIAVGDLNGDGMPDIVTVGDQSKSLTVLMNTTAPAPVLPATFAGSAALLSKKSLTLDHYLLSNDARTLFGLTADGDLELVVNDVRVWHSDTAGQGVTSALMNKSGALELLGTGGAVVWSSNTTKKNASLKVLDGRVVVTLGSKVQWTQGSAIPALVAKGSNTLSSGGTLKANRYLRSKAKTCVAAVIDGELMLWGPGGHVRYRTGTGGSLATQLKLQTTGNLQLLTAAKAPVWSTNTLGKSAKLVVAPATTCELKLATKTTTLFTAP